MATIAQSPNDNYAVTVGTSSAPLVLRTVGGDASTPKQVTVHNAHASQLLYVGFGSDVSAANGLPIPAGTYKQFALFATDEMHAIASGASTSARVGIVHGKGDPS
jgi:hypothetical protein